MFGALYNVFLVEVALRLGLDGSAKAVIGDDDQRTAERLHGVGMQPAAKGFHISSIGNLRMLASEYAGKRKP